MTTLLAVSLAAGLALDRVPAPPNQARLAVLALDDSIEVLAVGSSHLYESVDPELTQMADMNLGAAILNFECVETLLATHLPRLPKLKAVVLEVDILSLIYDTLRLYNGDYRGFLDLDPDLAFIRARTFTRFGLYLDQLLGYGHPLRRVFSQNKLEPRAWLGTPGDDLVVKPGYENSPSSHLQGMGGATRVLIHTIDTADTGYAVALNRAAFKRIAGMLRARGLSIVLVRFPHHESYLEHQPTTWEPEVERLIDLAESELAGVHWTYFDFIQTPSYPDELYRDGDHINHIAALHFSAFYDRKLSAFLAGAPSTAR